MWGTAAQDRIGESRCPVTVHERQIGNVTIVDMQGRITIQDGADTFRGTVRELVALSRVHIVLNFRDVPYIDSTGLGELVRTHLSVSRRGGKLALLQVPPKIRQLLSVTRLLPVFDAFDDENQALDSCRQVRGSAAEPS